MATIIEERSLGELGIIPAVVATTYALYKYGKSGKKNKTPVSIPKDIPVFKKNVGRIVIDSIRMGKIYVKDVLEHIAQMTPYGLNIPKDSYNAVAGRLLDKPGTFTVDYYDYKDVNGNIERSDTRKTLRVEVIFVKGGNSSQFTPARGYMFGYMGRFRPAPIRGKQLNIIGSGTIISTGKFKSAPAKAKGASEEYHSPEEGYRPISSKGFRPAPAVANGTPAVNPEQQTMSPEQQQQLITAMQMQTMPTQQKSYTTYFIIGGLALGLGAILLLRRKK